MNQDQRKALKLARELIESHECRYICDALREIAGHHRELKEACRELRAYIWYSLNGHISLEMWQFNQRIYPRHGWLADARYIVRMAWIDWMLGHEAKARKTLDKNLGPLFYAYCKE